MPVVCGYHVCRDTGVRDSAGDQGWVRAAASQCGRAGTREPGREQGSGRLQEQVGQGSTGVSQSFRQLAGAVNTEYKTSDPPVSGKQGVWKVGPSRVSALVYIKTLRQLGGQVRRGGMRKVVQRRG